MLVKEVHVEYYLRWSDVLRMNQVVGQFVSAVMGCVQGRTISDG